MRMILAPTGTLKIRSSKYLAKHAELHREVWRHRVLWWLRD